MNYPDVDATMAAGFGAAMLVYWLVMMAICIVCIVAEWKLFVKAGEPGWAVLIPFYGQYVLFKIAMGNGWLFLLAFVPIVNIVVSIMVLFKLAQAFGKGIGYGFGLLFLAPIFICMLAFGDAEYVGA